MNLQKVEQREVYTKNGEYHGYVQGTPEIWKETIVVDRSIAKWNEILERYILEGEQN